MNSQPPLRRPARFGAALALGVAFALTVATPAVAEDPFPLEGAYIVDDPGVLGDRAAEVAESLDALADDGVNLFVVIVDRFTGVDLDDSWADAMADLNRFGDRDILFAIAVDDRNFDISIPVNFELSKAQMDRLEIDHAVPRLRVNDYAGALIAYADELRAELTTPGDTPPTDAPPATPDAASTPINWPLVGGIVVVGGGAIYLYRRSRKKKSVEATKLNQKQLDVRAGGLLVQLDDQVKTSEQDLSFAMAEFGEAAVKPFVTALEGARAKLREAFEIRQKLDDAFPETDEEKRTLTLTIIELCEAADAELDAQADAFDELRELEKNAPVVLETATKDAAAAREALTAARSRVAKLSAAYSAAAVASIASNPEQADDLLAFADAQLAEARAALEKAESGVAAVAVHSAQAALGQVTQLFEAIDHLEASLTGATTTLSSVIADTEQDLAAARALPASSDARLEQAIVETQAALTSAASTKDPLTALATLQATNARLDTVLEAARQQHEHVQAATRSLDHAIATARSEISAANDYITTRRGGIGGSPRTRVSEAMRHLDSAVALAASNPVGALAEARAASGLAHNALASAQVEVQSLQNRGGYGAGYGGGTDIGGAILGGIIGSLLGGGSPGGSSPGSWGGGSSRGSIRGGGSSRGSRSGSFGGSSRRPSSSGSRGGRRSSGGRF